MFKYLIFFAALFSAAVRDDLRQRDDDLPADVLDDGPLPRHAEQRARVHEAARRAQGAQRTRHGLRRLNVGRHQGH